MTILKDIEDCRHAGMKAYKACAIRLAPICELLELGGMDAVDAWYEGYDQAAGHGPYFGTTARQHRENWVPKKK